MRVMIDSFLRFAFQTTIFGCVPRARTALVSAVLLFSLLGIFPHATFAAKAFPPPPVDYVYDESSALSARAHQALSLALKQEDQKTGNQVLVAVFKSLEDEDLVDYCNRLYQSWKIGQKEKSNGVILAIFMQERKIRIEVGYGLEPILTDAHSKEIISGAIEPAFRRKDFDTGVIDGIRYILNTIQVGADPNATPLPPRRHRQNNGFRIFFPLFFILMWFIFMIMRSGGYGFSSTGGRTYRRGIGGVFLGGGDLGGGYRGGGFGGGSGGSFGGGGGFSGGGGSSGGGGASGGW